MQNSRSVFHQPAIRSVATTDVAQPLTMLTALAATAVLAARLTGQRAGQRSIRRARAVALLQRHWRGGI